MTRLNTEAWGEFKIKEIFDSVVRAKRRTINSYEPGDTPYVTNSSLNNGISAYLDPKHDGDLELGQCITLNTVDGSAFWQERDFLANSSGNGLLMLRKQGLKENAALFICTILSNSLDPSYATMLTMDVVKELPLKLPVTSSGEPDWDYMEDYVRHCEQEQIERLRLLLSLGQMSPHHENASTWGEFPLPDLFQIKNTKSITAAQLTPDSGSTPYVTAQEKNNGVQMYVHCPEDWTDPGPCILIGGKTLTFSYQATDFCSNDSHNIALYSKDPAAKPLAVQLYLISVLRASLSHLFSWGDSISKRRTAELSIKLPQTSQGTPDWDYMEDYMTELFARKAADIDLLEAMIPEPTEVAGD